MKILHVHEKFWPYNGGSTTRLLNLIDTSKDVHYVLARKHCNLLPDLERLKNNIVILRYKSDVDLIKLLIFIFKNKKIDVYHIHNIRASFLFLLFLPFAKRTLLELHSIYLPSNKFKKLISKFGVLFYKKVLLLSSSSKKLFTDNFWGRQELTVIENGVSLSRFRFKRNLSGNVKVCYVGSLKEFQGVGTFVKIANNIKRDDIEFHIYGGVDTEISELKQKDLKNKVFFHGQVDYMKIHEVYSKMDILLMTRPKMKSTDSAIPIKPIEALSVGLDVFSTDVGGMREIASILNTEKLQILSYDCLIDVLEGYTRPEQHAIPDLTYFDKSKKTRMLEEVYRKL